ncbi:hypothetical protein EPH95_05510 [Salicibibacter halophilus]|uniref:Uncharacterized protein n=1 Tax=Salicibibacter halophilus TaxID=2502791 RepID=A0A514LFU5_9BACI|nr:hypothetical protein [Salicibibacter halophilus]QDI90699.1 hypothetical protein EPH95_05510 [Salicibibacter halophilus]
MNNENESEGRNEEVSSEKSGEKDDTEGNESNKDVDWSPSFEKIIDIRSQLLNPMLDNIASNEKYLEMALSGYQLMEQNNEIIRKTLIDPFQPMIEHVSSLRIPDPLERMEDLLSDGLNEILRDVDYLLKSQVDNFWCLDMDVVDAIKDEIVSINDLAGYVDRNLEEYVETIANDPIYELHSSTIQESYKAYRAGYYKISIFPLLSACEHVIASWFDGNINKNEINIKVKPKSRLYTRMKQELPNVEGQEEEATFLKGVSSIFANNLMRMFFKLFVSTSERLSKQLNRHSILHGFHDYDSITREQALQLFQLLKSTLIIKDIDFDQISEETQ